MRILEFGDLAGVPAVYFHGTPSSASEARWLDRAALVHGVRVVAIDRPGYLDSALNGDRSLIGGARAGLAAAAELGLESFAAVGFSGGAGYALTAAQLAPERVTVVHLAGGAVAGDLPGGRGVVFAAARRAPRLVGPAIGLALRLNLRGLEGRLNDPRAAARWFFEGPAKGAQVAAVEVYVAETDPELLRAELLDLARAARSVDAVVADLAAYAQPWPFDVASVRVPVELWHGLADPAAPPSAARRLAAALPNATLHAFEDEGHFVVHSHADEIAASIREHAR